MTHSAIQPTPRRTTGVPSQEGPVMLATKVFTGLDAPLAVARWLATREERELHVVSVFEQGDAMAATEGVASLPHRRDDDDRDALAAQISRALTPYNEHGKPPVVEIVDGPSASGVVDAAQRCNARVIVIGTGKHDPIGRHVYGERALEIVSISDRPVLIVPREATAASLSVAVVAVDFSQASVRAARAVLPMLSQGGHLILVHVQTAVGRPEEDPGWGNDAYGRRCAHLFAHFQRQLPSIPGVTVETRFFRGDAVGT